jgi:rRNA-processing protein FCF1
MLIKGEEYLCIITEISKLAEVHDGKLRKSVYQIKDVQFHPIVHAFSYANDTGSFNGK